MTMTRILATTALAASFALATAATAAAYGGADANGEAQNSPGIVSGNLVQAPVQIPINACGDSISVVGLLDSAFGDRCEDL